MIERAHLIANGDQRLSANQTCWPAQQELERRLTAAFAARGVELVRAHAVDPDTGHGFLSSQAEGLRVLATIPADEPVVVAEGVWQFSQQVLGGLLRHRGPVLTVANWEGQWPGLVGLLNLNASLSKAGREFDTLWSRTFDDAWFGEKLDRWLAGEDLQHDASHVRAFDPAAVTDEAARAAASEVVDVLRRDGAVMGVLDEGCMGMYNAIIPDELLFPLHVFKERLSQAALFAETMAVPEDVARASYDWLLEQGMTFHLGTDEATELTEAQVLLQLRMYAAIARMADRFGCDVIGTQYQLGLADVLPASDLAEGLLNNSARPDVVGDDGAVVRPGLPVVHFNEADECAGLDALLTHRLHLALGQPVETTLHDVRWGDHDASGTQYQLGLADVRPASDRAEGLRNNSLRPDVVGDDGSVIRPGLPVVHFNEADECAGLDALLTHRLHLALGQPVETTLHDVRWGDHDASGTTDAFVWVFEISGPAPAAHHVGGYAGTDSMRQPPLYFRLGGGTVRGIARPGELVWSRVFVEDGALHLDVGRASVVDLPQAETDRRWAETTPEWPIMHAVLHGVDRDQFMARHRSNHVQVVYADDAEAADRSLAAKALAAAELGMRVSVCGSRADGSPLV